ncbi:HipA domain-containing protein [Pseudobacteriovorax antillogorgiicola]|nr:HipA domain-containing protein [Pseudobacteriovorax antillogorgiicola]
MFIPRFDRISMPDKAGVKYFGMESFYSAHNINIHGTALTHEENFALIQAHSSEPQADILEYLKRIYVNRFFSNPDNHGHNTSFIKDDDSVRLSPIYDVAPMMFFKGDHIVELTRWSPKNKHSKDSVLWLVDEFELDLRVIKESCKELENGLSKLHADFGTFGIPQLFVEKGKHDRDAVLSDLSEIEGI